MGRDIGGIDESILFIISGPDKGIMYESLQETWHLPTTQTIVISK